VLNLTVAMKQFFLVMLSFLVIMASGFALPENIAINYPQNGQSVRGVVEITGSVVSDLFLRGEIYYAYNNAENTTWFLIAQLEQPMENGVLARWDTTTITDGEYQIKIRLIKIDYSSDELIIQPVYVRNYSLEPTITPAPTNADVKVKEATPISSDKTFSTPFPQNPAAVSNEGIKKSIAVGITLTLLILAGLLLYRIIISHRQLK
jgi:hypothetical protein